MANKIAYLITHISYNCVYNNKGTIDEPSLKQFILDEVSEYIINNSCSTKFESIDDVIKFWERYGGYNVWEAYCVKDNNWINIKPSDEEILLNIRDMTISIEILENEILENEKLDEDENIFDLGKSILNFNLEENKIFEMSESETLEIVDMDEIIKDLSEESMSSGEDIEIDWNAISNEEQNHQ